MRGPVPEEAPDAAGVGELVQSREALLADEVDLDLTGETASLDWQPELDSALEAIDSVLPVKRRRATDPPGTAFPRPEVSVLTFTPEVLDALATRVAEKIRASQAPPKPPEPEEPALAPGKVLSIRFRWPLFSFGSRRRRSRARA
ncbi:MAG: hypothetical protein Q8N52_10265 [Acidobacteriota bacterium]|nr:hypothetical protein [Acidobacteriota bacterium]